MSAFCQSVQAAGRWEEPVCKCVSVCKSGTNTHFLRGLHLDTCPFCHTTQQVQLFDPLGVTLSDSSDWAITLMLYLILLRQANGARLRGYSETSPVVHTARLPFHDPPLLSHHPQVGALWMSSSQCHVTMGTTVQYA